ncbi:MAG: cysteine--tRNA ligase [bacterium]
MDKLYFYNTLTREKQEFKSIKKGKAGMYCCGPTVYNYAHIGNLRSYIFEDILKRVLLYNGYKVKHVMNITDVGHLSGDRDMGEDKLEIGAKREGKTAWQISEFYANAFENDLKSLNIIQPDIWCKATDHIKEQIALIKILERKGFTYKISDGIYYDTSKFKNYAKLSRQNLSALAEGSRVEKNPEKKNPTDFVLWKFSPKNVKRQMEWDSPWGVGFPGWHIECSAMSLKYLGDHFDIHCGGIDHVSVHHTNEIAQSEAATGKSPWVNYWMHNEFLNIAGGKKMAKSRDNFLTLENAFLKKGIDPLVFRFAALQTHYRKPMEYSEAGILNAEKGFNNLFDKFRRLTPLLFNKQGLVQSGVDSGFINNDFNNKFIEAINDDLNTPQALKVVNELLESNLKRSDIKATILKFDEVLGLGLGAGIIMEFNQNEIDQIERLVMERQKARDNKDWVKSDDLRVAFEIIGCTIEDTIDGAKVFKK